MLPPLTIGAGANSVRLADMDSDGDLDAVVAGAGGQNVQVLQNIGGGMLTPLGTFMTLGTGVLGIALGDLDNDGDIDVAVTNQSTNNVSVLRNQGTGSLGTASTFGVGTNPNNLDIGDLDNDGYADIIVGNDAPAGTLSFLKNNAGTGFTVTPILNGIGANPRTLALGDVDGDGDLDVATGNCGDNSVSVLLNNGVGVFAPVINTPFPAVANPNGIAMADVDGDGDLDIATASKDNARVAVWRNAPPMLVQNNVDPYTAMPNVFPTRNSNTANVGAAVSAVFTQNVSTATVANAPKHLHIHGMMRGKRTGAYVSSPVTSIGANSITPSLARGEQFWVTVTGASSSGQFVRTRPFVYGFRTAAGTGPGTFFKTSEPMLSADPRQAFPADVDGDGDIDLITSSVSDVRILLNDGTGTFSAGQVFTVGPHFAAMFQPVAVTTGDFNNDGRIDIAVSGNDVAMVTGRLYVILNNSGAFSTFTINSLTTPILNTWCLISGDFDADGNLDIAIPKSNGPGEIHTFRNNGAGIFTANGAVSLTSIPIYAAVGDMDNDGDLDLVVGLSGANINIIHNDGRGNFSSTPIAYPTSGSDPSAVAVADFDNDGDLDIAAGNGASLNFYILVNNGTGTMFPASGPYSVPSILPAPVFLSAADVNGDGLPDIIASNYGSKNISVHINVGAGLGYFTSSTTYPVSATPQGNAAADFDGDGDLDIAVINSSAGNSVTIFKNGNRPTLITTNPARNAASAPNASTVSLTYNPSLSNLAANVPYLNIWGSFTGYKAGGTRSVAASTVSANVGSFRSGEQVWVTHKMAVGAENIPIKPVSYGFTAKAGVGPGEFIPLPQQQTIVSSLYAVASGDFNGDGNLDCVVMGTTGGAGGLEVLLGDGISKFSSYTTLDVSVYTYSGIAVGDMDNNGTADIVALGGFYSGQVYARVFLNNGASAPTFSPQAVVIAPFMPPAFTSTQMDVSLADIDADGDLDIFGVSDQSGYIFFTNNNATGVVSLGASSGVQGLGGAVGDIDNDGDIDIAYSDFAAGTVTTRLNDGSGGFATIAQTLTTIGAQAYSLRLADIDNDGWLDLIAIQTQTTPSVIHIFRNTGAGSFATSPTQSINLTTLGDLRRIAVFDADGDGDIDIAVVNQNPLARTVVCLLNSAGNFGAPVLYALPGTMSPVGLTAGDFDNDGDIDLLAAGDQSICILKNSLPMTVQNNVAPFTANVPVTPARNSNTAASAPTISIPFAQNVSTATVVNGAQELHIFGAMRGKRTATYSVSPANTLNASSLFPSLYRGEQMWVTALHVANTSYVPTRPFVYGFRARAGMGPGTFFPNQQPYSLTGGGVSWGQAIADFNGDGLPDVIQTEHLVHNIRVFLGQPDGTFTNGALINTSPAAQFPFGITAGDFNNDGRQDFAALTWLGGTSRLIIGLNTGGSFLVNIISVPADGADICTADFDANGTLDICFVGWDNNIYVYAGNGTGGFVLRSTTPMTSFGSLAAGDINNDGAIDLFLVSAGMGAAYALNDGSGVFAAPVGIPGSAANQPFYVHSGDFNNDGRIDFVASTFSVQRGFTLFRNNGSGFDEVGFGAKTGAIFNLSRLGVADVNGDGQLDVVACIPNTNAATTDQSIQVWLNSGGSFAFSSAAGSLTGGGYRLLLADMDGDGDVDYINYPDMRTWFNQPPPTLSATPLTLDFGTLTVGQFATRVATLNGTNLLSSVTIGITRATVSGFSFLMIPSSMGATFSTQGTVSITAATALSAALQVRFTPTTNGTFSTTITVTTATLAPLTITVRGTAVLPRIPTPPVITALSTNAALIGTPVAVSGLYFTNVSQASIGGISTTVNVLSATEATVIVPTGLSIGVVVFGNSDGEGLSRDSVRAIVPFSPPPVVLAASPLVGVAGDIVRVTGANFSTGATTLLVGGMQYGSTFISSSHLTFSLLSGMQGAIVVRTPNGATTSSFIVRVIPPPAIQSITPTEASTGATFTIIGQNFENLRSLTATNMRLDSTSWSVDSLARRVTVRVLENLNAGTTIGTITLVTRSGEARFTPVYAAPGIVILPNILTIVPVGITPPSGGQAEIVIQEGNEIQLQVQNIPTGATITLFINGIATTLATVQTSASLTTLRALLPLGLVPVGQFSISSVQIALTAGTRITTATFAFPVGAAFLPRIASFSPSVGGTCSTISIRGENFGLQPRGLLTNVLVGGVPVRGFRVVSPTLIQATAGTVRSGAITLITSSGAITITTTAQFTFDPNFPCLPAMRREDSLALDAFYVATIGQNWTTSSNWTNPDVPAALRFGVKTVGDRVTEIRLPANNLSGSIPEAVMRGLLALKVFDVNDNRIADVLPRAMAEATNLEILRLRRNRFTGTLPNIGALTRLREFDAAGNGLEGGIEALTGAEALEILDVSGNRLTGRIDAGNNVGNNVGIGRLTKLRFLNLSQNQLSGTLPQELGQLRELQSLLLRGNRFTGALPRALGQDATVVLTKRNAQIQAALNLEVLDVGANALSGTIPEELGSITTLKQLCLDSNTFTGSFPPALLALTRLRRLEAGYNRLSGEIPDFRSIARLDTLAVEGNRYTVAALESLAGVQTFRYVPQDFDERRIVATFQNASGATVGTTISTTASVLTLTLNEPLTLSLPRTESFSRIEWRKNGLPLTNPDTSRHAPFTIPAFALSDTGVYECFITNDRLDKIALKTASLQIVGQLPTAPPAAVRLITPSLGEEDVAAEPPFAWTSSLYATQYRIELAADTSFTQILSGANLPQSVEILNAARALIQRGTSASTATQTLPTFFGSAFPLAAGRGYAWRVRAENGVGASAWATGMFTTALPGEAVTVLPLDFGRVAIRDTAEGMLTVRNLSDIPLRLESLTANNTANNAVFTPEAIPPGTVLAARGEIRLKVRVVSATPGSVLAGVTVGFRASANAAVQTRTQQNRLAARIQAVKLIAPLLDTVVVGRKTITTLQLVNLTDRPVTVRSAALMRKIPAYALNNAPVGFEIQARDTVPFLLETTAQRVGAVGEELLECTVLRNEATTGSGASRDLADTVQTSFRAVAREVRLTDRFIVVSLKAVQDSIAPGGAVTLEMTVRPTGNISYEQIRNAATPGFSARLRWNTDVLALAQEERGVRKAGAVQNDGMQSFSVPQSFWDGRSPLLLTVRGVALAGRTDATPIIIESLQWGVGSVFVVLLENSTFVAKACEAGGKRLVTSAKPTQLALIAPNPAKEQVSIHYTLREDGFTEIALIDANGKTVQTLLAEEQTAGEYSITWGLKGVPSGAYTVRLTTQGGVVSRGVNVVR